MNKETERIKKYYEFRSKSKLKNNIYSYFNINNLYMIHAREKKLLKLLSENGFGDLSNKTILDIGCGAGGMLRNFIQYGTIPGNLYGIDLIGERIKKAKEISANIHFIEGNASKLPYQSNFFDIISQYTVFTSIIDKDVKASVASEMIRVLRKSGIIVWYDMKISNPFDKNIKSIGKKEIIKMFPDCECVFYSVTLNPIISRILAKISVVFCSVIESLKIFNSHYFVIIRKKNI